MNLDITWSPNKKIVQNPGGSSINFTTWHDDIDQDEEEGDDDAADKYKKKARKQK
jgi:hypothetical protein